MVDKTITRMSVAMIKDDVKDFPQYTLPEGYSFCMYQAGYEEAWAELETSVGEFTSVTEAVEYFKQEFMSHPLELDKRCIFVKNACGKIVATSSAWFGDHFGPVLPRVHWLCVNPSHQGQGLAKALVTKTLGVFQDLGYVGQVYLTTRTWSWKAIDIYLDFGFMPYKGSEPANWQRTKVDFVSENELAWSLIFAKLKR